MLYGITKWSEIKEKVTFLLENWKKTSISVLFFIIAGIPQLAYWKYITGYFLYYSYEKEGFNFKHPRIIDGVFSYANGWLAYSPIMAFSLIGLYFLNKNTKLKLAILVFLPIHIYVIYSWWCWNYINGIGSRPMVETYPLLAFGMAAFWTKALDFKWIRSLALVFAVFAIYFFTSIVWQLSEGLIWTENANRNFIWYMLGKTKNDWRSVTMFDTREWQPDTSELKITKQLAQNNFEDSSNVNFVRKNPNSKFCYKLDKKEEFCPVLSAKINDIGIKKGQWIKAEVSFMREYMGQDFYKNSMFVISYNDKNGKPIKTVSIRLDNKSTRGTPTIWGWESNVWNKAYFFMKMNKDIQPDSEIKIYVWNPTDNPIFLDDASTGIYENKN